MTRIRCRELVLGTVKVQADMYMRAIGAQRVRVVRAYMLTRTKDESAAEEHVLVRYNDSEGPKSALLRVEGDKDVLRFSVACQATRKQEPKMIDGWYEREGAENAAG
ncbi:MAG: hypothetical protein PUD59_04925 [bacterium]|nr:hypothetical protein [bacterium]